MVRADTRYLPAEGQTGLAERILGVALRIGVAAGAIALLADYLVPESLQDAGSYGSVDDPFLSESNYE